MDIKIVGTVEGLRGSVGGTIAAVTVDRGGLNSGIPLLSGRRWNREDGLKVILGWNIVNI